MATEPTVDPVLLSVVRSVVGATTATDGWLLAREGDSLRVVAAFGERAVEGVGRSVPQGAGVEGYVATSGQPMALAPRPDDPRLGEGLLGSLGLDPTSILCVPCGDEESVLGALEVVDKHGGGSFSFDDVEIATLLATVAGAALSASPDHRIRSVSSPRELSAELEQLLEADPARYGTVASIVEALLARG